jgi:deoxyribonuclease IV
MESFSEEEERDRRVKGQALFLGSHLSLKAPSFYLGTAQTALAYGETAFMFYTSSPQSFHRLPLETLKIAEGRSFLKEHHFDESKIVVHAPYLLNLGNPGKEENYHDSIALLKEEVQRTAAFGASLLVLHPGCAVSCSPEEGLLAVAKGLDEVFSSDGTRVTVCLETMAGKGSELGRNFAELATIIRLSSFPDRLGVCLDTCHINDAGMDEKDVGALLKDFDAQLGLSRLKVIHLNDSKNPMGSHKDRHENLGYGTLGFSVLSSWAWDPRLVAVPKILETPSDGIHEPYEKEIKMLRDNQFVPGWREAL